MKKIALLLSLNAATFFAFAQSDGSLDLTFDSDGLVTIDNNSNTDDGNDLLILEDKSIVVGGTSYINTNDFSFCSFIASGALNTSFGTDGKLQIDIENGSDDYMFGLALDSSERIVGAGYSGIGTDQFIIVVRISADGIIDNSFGTNGIVKILPALKNAVFDVATQPDNKIIIGGYVADGLSPAKALVIRLNEDGSLDGAFGDNGVWEGSPDPSFDCLGFAIALQPDGKILIGGYHDLSGDTQFAVGRINSGGSMDVSFDTDGWAVKNLSAGSDILRGIALQSDGKILMAGESNGEVAIWRINSDGTDDTGFGDNGTFTDPLLANDDVLYSVITQPDGNILAAGGGSIDDNVDFLLLRLTSDGVLDPTFDGDGIVYTNFYGSNDYAHSILLQPDSRIIAAGSAFFYYTTDFAVARYSNSFTGVENYSNMEGMLVFPNPSDGDCVISLPGYENEEIVYQLTDETGKTVKAGSLVMKDHQLSLEIHYLPPGVYFIELNDSSDHGAVGRAKIIKR